MKSLLSVFACAFLFTGYGQQTISNVNPEPGIYGSSVTITGNGFNNVTTNNKVHFGSVEAPVLSGTTSQLTVSVPSGIQYDFITVTDISNNTTGYSAIPFYSVFQCAVSGGITNSSFSSVSISAGSAPRWNATGDINGDGKPDLVTANYLGGNISVFKNTNTVVNGFSSASLTFDSYLLSGTNCRYIELSDINSDGKLDVLCTNEGSSTFSVFINTSSAGNISFASRVDFSSGNGTFTLKICDLNRDSKPDVVAVNKNSNDMYIFQNIGTSSNFTISSLSSPLVVSLSSTPSNVLASDFDGDQYQDLIVCNATGSSVSVFRNNAAGGNITNSTFALPVTYITGSIGTSVNIADLTGDNMPEILVTSYSNNYLSVFQNISSPGTLSFASRVDFVAGAQPYRSAVADFDSDSRLDVAIANSGSNSISIFRNIFSSGSFSASSLAPKVDLVCGSTPYYLSACDMDEDGTVR